MTNQQDKVITVKGTYISLIQMVIAGAIGIGSFLAYSESKYTNKEMFNIEVDQRKSDNKEIKDMIAKQNDKLDKLIERFIGGRR